MTDKDSVKSYHKINDLYRFADLTPALIWASDANENCIYFNKNWLNFRNRTLNQELDNGWVNGIHPEEADMCLKTYTDAFSRQEEYRITYRLLHHSGEYRWIQEDGTPRYNARGDFIGFISYCIDITGHKLLEKQLRNNEERLKLYLEATPDSLLVVDVKGIIVLVNKQTEKLFGYSRKEIIGKPVEILLPERFRRGHIVYRKEYNKNPRFRPMGHNFDIYALHKKGTVIPVEISLSYQIIENDFRVLCTIRDISERKEKENIIKKLNKHNTLILDAIGEGIYGLDLNGNMTFVNPAAAQMLGSTIKKMVGKAGHAHHHHTRPDGSPFPRGECSIYGAMLDGKTHHVDNEVFWREDGTSFPVEYTSTPVFDEQKKITGSVVVFEDITKRKQYEANLKAALEKAQESDRLKSAFLTNVSHEIRTPMNGIIGFSQLLKDAQLSSDDAQTYIDMIEKSGRRMLNTIADIIDISMIEAGQINIRYSEVSVNDQMEDLKVFFERKAHEKGIEINCAKGLSDPESVIQTDKEKLQGICTNLLQNALKYTNEGKIEYGYEKKGGMLVFFVKDTGIGIPDDKTEIIFDRFVQADLSLSKSYEGAGLGLSIAKAYVEMLGGKIWVISEEGKGSQFFFTLPYKKEKEEMQEVAKENEDISAFESQLKNLSVLVAEDDEISLIYLSTLFKDHCQRVMFAKNGEEAFELYKNNGPFDLVLMDIRMPVMDGHTATMKIKEYDERAYIVALTAYAFTSDREKALAAGCDNYISKPFRLKQLIEILEQKK